MSGYVGNDGSALAGGLNSSNQVQGLSVDNTGKLNVNASVSSGATNITQVNGVAVGATNGLPVAGNNGGALVVLDVDSSGRLIIAPDQLVQIANGANVLAVDASGRLTLVPNSSINTAQWNGAAPGPSNPVITEQNIQNWLRNGQVFRACTGTLTSPTGVTTLPVNLFNPNASGKTILLFSVRFNYPSNQITHQLTSVAANPAYASSVTPVNLAIGNGATSVVTSVTFTAVNTAVAGTQLDQFANTSTGEIEALASGGALIPLIIQANKGVTLWVSSNTGGNTFSVSFTWAEF